MKALLKKHWADPAGSILLAGSALAILFALIQRSFSILIEGALLTLILTLVLRTQPMRGAVQRWPRPWRISATVFLILLVAGQLNGKIQDTFPFTRWDMYTTGESREVVSYVEFFGQHADGSEVKFVANSGGMIRIRTRLLTLAREMNDPQLSAKRRENARRQFDQYGPLVVEVYNRDHRDQPIQSYKVYENRKYLKEHPKVERVLLATWPLKGDGE